MKPWIKHAWFIAAVLLLIYVFDLLVLGITRKVVNPLGTYASNITVALIALFTAFAILFYLNYKQYEKD